MDRLKRFAVVVGENKDIGFEHTRVIVEKLLHHEIEVFLSPEVQESLGLGTVKSEPICEGADFVICVGGDGTFLKAARKAFTLDKPVLGINRGTVGFLAEVETSEIDQAITRVLAGKYTIEPRMVLHAEVIRDGKRVYQGYAINDAVVTRSTISRVLRLMINVDGKFVDSFGGDGVIISSPTGSTGYTLAAGGPIVQPDMRLILVSPICPHILYSRTFVVSDSKNVSVSIVSDENVDAMITLDGQEGFPIRPNDLVNIRAAENSVSFVSVKDLNFYDVLRAKIRSGN